MSRGFFNFFYFFLKQGNYCLKILLLDTKKEQFEITNCPISSLFILIQVASRDHNNQSHSYCFPSS